MRCLPLLFLPLAACEMPAAEVPAAPAVAAREGPSPRIPARFVGAGFGTLGNAIEPGPWVRTSLIDTLQPGFVIDDETGRFAEVTLIPVPGPKTRDIELGVETLAALGIAQPRLVIVSVYARNAPPI